MFLPVLLVRDFGIWGFVIFAVPNVVGAAGMGWVLRASSAANILNAHFSAVRAFTEVTWAFQLFFLLWFISSSHDIGLQAVVIGFALVILQCVVAGYGTSPRANQRWAGFLWLMSASFLTFGAARGLLTWHADNPELDPRQLVWLSPVCAFGFLLCPYLDVTFLLARRSQLTVPARGSFTIGFGLLFLAMIVFTLLYAGQFVRSGAHILLRDPTSLIGSLIFLHLLLQISFTVFAHGSARVTITGRRGFDWTRGASIGILTLLVAVAANWPKATFSGLNTGEVMYRLFMSFYGLVFPAYVWICMIPVRGEQGTRRPTRAKLLVLAIAVVLAAPCYWMGFIERQTCWLGPGLGIVLMARLFVPRATSGLASAAATGPSAPHSV
jgi:hypothetical protein